MPTNKVKKYFTEQLISWHATDNDRSLPWKNESDPYKIWLSEIILQQTRAAQGLPYYLRFIDQYPTVGALANAKDEDVFRLWQGLGYYNRCKNMLATARHIAADLKGTFPQTYEDILSLKGVGPYTAAAIASFAFGLPHAVVDGNVFRVLARYFGIDTPFDTTAGKIEFTRLAGELLDPSNSSAYNQAIMDLGATICTPRNPICNNCPIQKNCIAKKQDMIHLLPVRSKKLVVRQRYFNYLLLLWKEAIWIHKRTGRDIWENLHEPYLIETTQPLDNESIEQNNLFKKEAFTYRSLSYNGHTTQRLTHQLIEAHFFTIQLTDKPKITSYNGVWIDRTALSKLAFPKTLVSFLENNLYF